MKLFISWSGEKARKIAELTGEWAKCLFPAVEPFVSSDDIEKGELWARRLSDVLGEYNFGVVILTKQNRANPWICFETGALSKIVEKARVIPLLCDLTPGDLIKNPLGLFQGEQVSREGLLKVARAINSQLEKKLDEEHLKDSFEVWWEKKAAPICVAAQIVEKGASPATPEVGSRDVMARLERMEAVVSEGLNVINERLSFVANEVYSNRKKGRLVGDIDSPRPSETLGISDRNNDADSLLRLKKEIEEMRNMLSALANKSIGSE